MHETRSAGTAAPVPPDQAATVMANRKGDYVAELEALQEKRRPESNHDGQNCKTVASNGGWDSRQFRFPVQHSSFTTIVADPLAPEFG